jgi:uncharacterized damage-inducible protein DinB
MTEDLLDTLHELFRYHTWATLNLIDYCAGLSPEHLQATAPGTAGTIADTLLHLVAAEGRYLERLPGGTPGSPVHESTPRPLPELRSQFELQAQRWQELLDLSPKLDVTMPAQRGWPETPHVQVLMFLQALHHGNDHRTHIGTILGANGLPAPDLDGWAYWSTVHHGLA